MAGLLLDAARAAFRALPLNQRTKMELAFRIFALTGSRFAHLPAYQSWLRERAWFKMKVPENVARHNARILTGYFESPPGFLMVNHRLGGGTGQHVAQLTEALTAKGIASYVLENHNGVYARLIPAQAGDKEPLFFRLESDGPALVSALRILNIRHAHLHHTLELGNDFPKAFGALMAGAEIPYDYTVHDYFSICPRFTLFDEAVRGYCGEPSDPRKCDACVHRFGSAAGNDVDVAGWRSDYGKLLAGARKVFAPNEDVARRLHRYMPDAPLVIKPHPELSLEILPVAAARQPGEGLRVVIVGGIAPHKGSNALLLCAEDARARHLPIEFTLIGFSDIDHKLKTLPNVTVTGRFAPQDLPKMLAEGQFHLAFLPSVIPETYNYALSECWRSGLFTACFTIGAIAERVRKTGFGAVMPLEWYFRPQKVNDFLLAQYIPPAPVERLRASFTQYPDILTDYYELS